MPSAQPARPCRAIAALAFLAFLALALAAPGARAGHAYIYRGKPIPLAIDPSRIAVVPLDSDSPPLAVGLTLMPHGFDPTRVGASPARGIAFAQTPANTRLDADAEALADRLARDPAVGFVSPVFLGPTGPMIASPRVFLRFRPGVTREREDAILASHGLGAPPVRDASGIPGLIRAAHSSRSGIEVVDAAHRLATLPEVEFAEPDFLASGAPALSPNDPLFPSQWALRNPSFANIDLGATAAWDITTGSPSVIIAVFDDGVQQNHPDINQLPGLDFSEQGSQGGPVSVCDRHGTAVAGIIAGRINNSIGIAGIAPNARVVSCKFTLANSDCNGFFFYFSWLTDAIAWARDNARITNNSNILSPSSTIDAAYQAAYSAGVVHFAAAGNNGSSSIAYPASIGVVNAVGAITSDGSRAAFSQYGAGLDFVGPGQNLWTTDRTGSDGYTLDDYTLFTGTSGASPYIAGVAALVASRFPSFTPAQIEDQLRATARRLGPGPFPNAEYGYGMPRADLAVQPLCLPSITRHPSPIRIESGARASFTAAAGSSGPALSYRWMRNGTPLSDGGSISGALTSTLVINPAGLADAGSYTCAAQNTCGAATSNPASLTVSCPGDANADGLVTQADLTAILFQFGQTGTGLAGDLNGDGAVTFADLNIVLSNFGRSC